MDKKYVVQAFEMQLKGRFDLLARFYGDYLFDIPAQIIIHQIKDELGITVSEDAIYNLKRRRKTKQFAKDSPAPVAAVPDPLPEHPPQKIPEPSSLDPGTQVENAIKELKGKKNPDFDFDGM